MAFFVFILGIIVGSFLNVLIDRIPRKEKITGRSHCEKCNKNLRWTDLIPILSFVLLRGKCRYCKSSLSIQYPLVEAVTGFLYLAIYFFVSDGYSSLIFNLFFISVLIVVFVTDIKYGIIPDKIIFPSLLVITLFLILTNQFSLFNNIISALGAFFFFYFLFVVTKAKGIGFGDVKLSLLLGLFLGFPKIFFALYLAFLTGGLVGLILILWKKKRLKSQIPFGPFLVLGTIIVMFFGREILILFQNLL